MSDLAHVSPAFEPASLLGLVLDGRYELTAHLATGGMGAVFRARHVHLRREFAVKVLRPELTGAPEIVDRFRKEAQIASALEHENIVRVSDFGSWGGHLFLVMDLLTGESLFDRLRREGFLPPDEAVPILWQICNGLAAAHALGVVHRDLKPENVFLARTPGGREVVKVLDFGIAKLADPAGTSATQAGMVVGTPEYLSPEQATGGPIDARADLYGVGLIAWRMLAGRHPFRAEDARGLLMMQATQPVPPLTDARSDLPRALVAAVARACAKDPAARQPDAEALAQDFRASVGPAFLLPPGATPAPPLSLSPAPRPSGAFGRPSPVMLVSLETDSALPIPTAAMPALSPRQVVGRVGAGLARRARTTLHIARAHPFITLGLALAALGLASSSAIVAWYRERPAALAREHLAAGRTAEARAAVGEALGRRPGDPQLLLLQGRALHRAGDAAGAIEAWQAARAGGAVDQGSLADLASYLGRERALADRAARLLRDVGPAAVPAVADAAREGSAAQRLRALALLRDLGAEDRVDRVAAYVALLGEADCELRRAAARRLGEIGDAAALAKLRELASSRVEKRGFFGQVSRSAVCGATESAEAIRRIEASR